MHHLSSAAALALVGIGLVNSVKLGTEANLARTHLRNHEANCSMCVSMDFECVFSRPGAELKELSTIFRVFPG